MGQIHFVEGNAESSTFDPRLRNHPRTGVKTVWEVSRRRTNLLRIETALTLLIARHADGAPESARSSQFVEVYLLGRGRGFDATQMRQGPCTQHDKFQNFEELKLIPNKPRPSCRAHAALFSC